MNQNKPAPVVADPVASPPPTAGVLPIIERANLNTPYSGGGGGGGGSVGPNPVVSTLTTNAGWTGGPVSTFDIAGSGEALVIGGDAIEGIFFTGSSMSGILMGGPNFNSVEINGGQLQGMNWISGLTNPDNNNMTLNISTTISYFASILPGANTSLEIQSDQTSTLTGNVCGSLELGALPDGRSFVGAALGYSVSSLSTLMLIGDGVNVSSLNVSSVNGGIPALTSLFSTLFAANPSLSTIVY